MLKMMKYAAVMVLAMGAGVAMAGNVRLQGAGSTFVNPMMQRWVTEYQKVHPNILIDYQSIGSGGGIKAFTDKTVDFGCSDAPLSKTEIEAAGGADGIIEYPLISGGVVPAYNVPNVKDLKFSGAVLADIFAGKIGNWNDAAIAKLNPDVTLPNLPITPAWRTDGSGTTFIFTNYLATQSEDFKSSIGMGKQVKWPVGQGGKGNEGVAAVVQNTAGAIGYIEQAYADQNKISYGAVENKAGKFVKATPAGVSKAGEGAAEEMKGNLLQAPLWNQKGDEAYPISGFTYVFLYKDLRNVKSAEQAQALVDFLRWSTHDGQKIAPDMDYAGLSEGAIKKVDQAMEATTFQGKAVKGVDAK